MSKPVMLRCPRCKERDPSIVCVDEDAIPNTFSHLAVVCERCGFRIDTGCGWGDEKGAADEWNTLVNHIGDEMANLIRIIEGMLSLRILSFSDEDDMLLDDAREAVGRETIWRPSHKPAWRVRT